MTAQTVYLALGSNLGDRAQNLRTALRAIATFASVEETSHLYQTPAAYVTDQPDFLNAVCCVQTALSPHELLHAIETTMVEMGRVRTVRYGPRVIDIDILLYADLQLTTDELVIPHPRMGERDFVLEPLCDMAPELPHPTLHAPIRALWQRLNCDQLSRVMPFGDQLWVWGAQTYVMGIINATPDSFSGDGLGEPSHELVAQAVTQATRMVAAGADCLDVGGHSTRPGHGLLPAAVEIARVAPVIEALTETVNVPISVDTFRKTAVQSLELSDRLNELKRLGYPLLFGSSRKGFIGKTLGGLSPEERVEGTIATSVLAIDRGADILRVHDALAVSRAAQVADAVVRR